MTPSHIIDSSWQLYQKNFSVFLVPLGLLVLAGASAMLSSPNPSDSPTSVLTIILAMLVFSWIDGAFIVIAANLLANKSEPAQAPLVRSLKILGPLVALSFISQFLISAGIVLLIIPGIALAYLFSLALPDLVIANRGLFPSLRASVSMTIKKENLWPRVLAIAVPWIFWQVVVFLGAGILIMIAAALARAFPEPLSFLTSRSVFILSVLVISSITRPLALLCRVMVYQKITSNPQPPISNPS